ncbi:MAG: glucose dehydrogenase [Planctomycetes bacterium]|jgi:glucose/arabinose dehydrogenase|nr:glucose dehydrogenase [Planctomycetota bacterium]MDP6409819.1 PQQ-dependent sugar dehydrogenase [Planctomycetota bacterium]
MSRLLPLLLLLAAPAASGQRIAAVRVASGLDLPTSLCTAPGDARRLFVTTNRGVVHLIRDGQVEPQPFLDLSGVVEQNAEGLLCMVFHPDHASNGRFYVTYQDPGQNSRLVQYEISSDPDVADPASAVTILGPQPQPDVIHNWNCLRFGPDGMLYVGIGDGGLNLDPNDHAQSLSTTFGKLLRLDVDLPPPHVPPDNPFVGVPGAEEAIWIYGLRQPWRFSFDREQGNLWIGDVGQGDREEIDFQRAGSTGGENYGWRCMEGTDCTLVTGCACAAPSWLPPVYEYDRLLGDCCVVGGYVYRGAAMPAEQGRYFFGDFCSARVWSLRFDGSNVLEFAERTSELVPCGGATIDHVVSFGEDADGELYILDTAGGEVFKLVPAGGTAWSYCFSGPNSAGAGARISHGGTTSVSSDDFELRVDDAVAGQFGLFYYGPQRIEVPFGDGVRCIGGASWRLNPPQIIDSSGHAARPVDFDAPVAPGGELDPGDTWNFQFWYRDPPGPGGTGFNLSDAISVTFCP